MKKFKFLAWEIGLKCKRKSADERILFLANKLYDELERAGQNPYTVNGSGYVTVWHHDKDNFAVSNDIAQGGGWEIVGKREFK